MTHLRAITLTVGLALPAQPALSQIMPRPVPRVEAPRTEPVQPSEPAQRTQPNPVTTTISPIGTQQPGTILAPQSALQANRLQVKIAGPMTLSVIDPGYVEDSNGSTRSTDFVACVNDGNGNAGSVSAITYTLNLPGGAKTGTMDLPVLSPPKKPDVLKGAQTQSAGSVAGCRRARVSLPSCQLQAGEVDLDVRADGLSTRAKTIIAPISSSVYIQYFADPKLGTPVTIAGNAGSRCGARPKSVTLTADGSIPVTAQVESNGQFSAPFTFQRAGSVRLTVAMEGDEDYESASAFKDVPVARIPITATVVGLPDQARIGGTVPVAVQLRSTEGNQPLSGVRVTFKIPYSTGCTATAGGDGIARCTMAVQPDDVAIGKTATLSLDVADASSLSFAATNKVLLTSSEGLVRGTLGGNLLLPTLAATQPAGVLISNFNPGWSGTGAHAGNASRVYTGPDLKEYQAFDIPSRVLKLDKHDVYYLNNIFIRYKPFVLSAPARIRADFYITGQDGHGPSIKGFCFWAWCAWGYDAAMPDVTDITLPKGRVEIDLAVVDGKIKPTLASIDVEVDFKCGGIAAAICAIGMPYLNDLIDQQLKRPEIIAPMLARVGANLDAQLAPWLKTWKMGALTSISWDGDGNLTAMGTPLAQ